MTVSRAQIVRTNTFQTLVGHNKRRQLSHMGNYLLWMMIIPANVTKRFKLFVIKKNHYPQ